MQDNNHLFTLIYTSVPSFPMEEQDLEDLLTEARSCNQAHDITGLLVYTGSRFIQVLEGTQSEVQGLYQRIVRDDRHHSEILVYETRIQQRCFSDWSMGYRLMEDEKAPYHGFSREQLQKIREQEPDVVLSLLTSLIN